LKQYVTEREHQKSPTSPPLPTLPLRPPARAEALRRSRNSACPNSRSCQPPGIVLGAGTSRASVFLTKLDCTSSTLLPSLPAPAPQTQHAFALKVLMPSSRLRPGNTSLVLRVSETPPSGSCCLCAVHCGFEPDWRCLVSDPWKYGHITNGPPNRIYRVAVGQYYEFSTDIKH
jgi:hypothetical protein